MRDQVILGLTGSIGMGKSTTAQMFRDLNVPVWDADAAVSVLYARSDIIDGLSSIVPNAVTGGSVNRDRLKEAIANRPDVLTTIERLIHPALRKNRKEFLTANATAALVVMDVPLLFETGGEEYVDKILVVTTSSDQQRSRVLGRKTMTDEMFNLILSRQMPDDEKRRLADFVIETNSLDQTRAEVEGLVIQLTGE